MFNNPQNRAGVKNVRTNTPPGSASYPARHLPNGHGKLGAGGALTTGVGAELGWGGRPELSATAVLRPTTGGGGGGGGRGGGAGGVAKGIGARQRVENSYRMDPGVQPRFTSHKVEQLLKDILDAKLHNIKYDADNCGRLAREVCSMIKDKTKEFEFSRYKLVTQVLLGQDSDQCVQIASRCLWNHETDNFAAATYRNNSLYAVAIVYGMYLD